MLKLRKILLCDYLYISLLILVILISIPRLSNYHEKLSTNKIIGTITNISKRENKVVLNIKSKENIIATYYKETNINLGDKVLLEGELSKPNTNTNENTFNYRNYLSNKNIYYTMKITSIKKLKSNKNIYYEIKKRIKSRLNNNPYLYTFILGDKSLINEEVKTTYQNNGISHLFCLSGMHITLFSLLILKVLSLLKLREEKVYLITTIFLLLYLFLVGLSPSILRGVLFYIIFTFNRIYYFYIKPVNLFIIVLIISLLINPKYILEVSFQYSYLICLSLLMIIDKLQDSNYFKSLLKVSSIAFLSSIPITLYNFYQINILSIIYNLFFVPLVSIFIFPLSLLCLIIPKLSIILNLFTYVLEHTSLLIDKISISKLRFMKVNILVYLIYLVLILLFIKTFNKKIFLILLIILSIHYLYPHLQKNTYINILDVGQGDSLLIHINSKNILLDTGGVPSYREKENNYLVKGITIPTLKSQGIKKLDYLILTHGDYDHMGEAIYLTNHFKVDKVIFNCGKHNYLEKELIKVLNKKHIKYYSCIKELNISNNKLYFLQTNDYYDENDNSNVIYTELNDYKFLFMGDASINTEKEILNKYNLPRIDILKVGHHGSKTSSSKEFIDKIKPKYSVISVGKDNKYSHPNEETLEVLKNTKIYRTDQDGSIMFKIKNNKLRIETCSP